MFLLLFYLFSFLHFSCFSFHFAQRFDILECFLLILPFFITFGCSLLIFFNTFVLLYTMFIWILWYDLFISFYTLLSFRYDSIEKLQCFEDIGSSTWWQWLKLLTMVKKKKESVTKPLMMDKWSAFLLDLYTWRLLICCMVCFRTWPATFMF
jgi:hypothetical protein